eukprot:2313934-Alexandrium_andersonii.AAC.1
MAPPPWAPFVGWSGECGSPWPGGTAGGSHPGAQEADRNRTKRVEGLPCSCRFAFGAGRKQS